MSVPEWVDRYSALIHAEYVRIGFTNAELLHLGSGPISDEAALQRQMDRLREVPSGIGAEEYYRREGIDYEPMRRLVAEYRKMTGNAD